MSEPLSPDHRYRFPPAIINHAVYLYFHFAINYRDVEEMLALRGIRASYKPIRRCLKNDSWTWTACSELSMVNGVNT